MGMAASQARFLGLTARKTNTEYEGQQINQQRTMLANKSANYYNDLLGMTVPTPPSVDEYTKTVYSFNDGALQNTITSLIAQADGKYLVSYTRTWTNDSSIVSASSSIINYNRTADVYSCGAKELRRLGRITEADIEKDEYLKTLSPDGVKNDKIRELEQQEQLYIGMLNDKYGEPKDGEWSVIYREDTTAKTWVPTFYDSTVLKNAVYTDNGSSTSFIPAYTVGAAVEREEVKGATAMLEQDSSGRYINITIFDESGNSQTYSLDTNSSKDDMAYKNAMNQYEYDKAQYEKSVQDINSKIEIVQAEDRSLELRLKQLDTEQKAISNEMEAVTKVIEKNVGDTFKTFNA